MDDALDWVVRLKAGEPTRMDIDALQRWRDLSPAHEEAFKKAALLLRNAGVAAQELAQERSFGAAVAPVSRSSPRHLTRRALFGGAAAAAAAGYLIVRPPFALWPSLQELSASYRTAKGEQRKVDIAADVSLELNTQTSVALRSASELELISGEASVVAKLPSSKSLVVFAAGGRVTASQADFNARCLDSSVLVTCLDGSVDVAHGSSTVRLQKDQQVSYSAQGLATTITVDPAQVTAWQTGQLIFRDQPLASVVDEVNRYRPGKIIITNASLKHRIVNGTFQLDKLENFVAQVEQLFGAHSTALPGGVVLLG